MAIKIKQKGEKWNLDVDDEMWEMETREEMESVLKQILDIKEKCGRVKY